MIVPNHWAEARLQERVSGKSVTIRRFGWSDESQKDAQAHAEERARDAMKRARGGEKVERRERKVPYNGAEGLPIREEILSRQGDALVTRNIYGARCINSPNVLFADVDFATKATPRLATAVIAGLLGGLIVFILRHRVPFMVGCLAVVSCFTTGYFIAQLAHRAGIFIAGGPERAARQRIRGFVSRHPDWHVRLYRTPAGLRALAMHRLFDPGEPDVAAFFDALLTDPIYVKMCRRQKCFRARVSPKPWRIGIQEHMKPRPGIWPIRPDRMPDRKRWVLKYEDVSRNFASCRFVESIGASTVDPVAKGVQVLHDDLSKSDSTLPIA